MPHVRIEKQGPLATIALDRPNRKNALTFDSYAQLLTYFQRLAQDPAIKAVVLTGEGNDFCSGGDVRDIIGPLTQRSPAQLLEFTQMTGDLVKAMRACPQPIIAAVDGVCAGAGAILAMASDIRYGSARATVAFLFTRVGLAGCDMGACAMLPRIVGHGRASELLYTGRAIDGHEALAWGFFNALYEPDRVRDCATQLARSLADGPTVAYATTKRMLHQEWNMPLDEAIDAEAAAQAVCMETRDFKHAYEAFIEKRPPTFEGK